MVRGGWEKNRGWLLHPSPLSGAYRAHLLPGSKFQRSLPWPAASSIHSYLGKGQGSWEQGNMAARQPLLVLIVGSVVWSLLLPLAVLLSRTFLLWEDPL